jgi:hypothetical protein
MIESPSDFIPFQFCSCSLLHRTVDRSATALRYRVLVRFLMGDAVSHRGTAGRVVVALFHWHSSSSGRLSRHDLLTLTGYLEAVNSACAKTPSAGVVFARWVGLI